MNIDLLQRIRHSHRILIFQEVDERQGSADFQVGTC